MNEIAIYGGSFNPPTLSHRNVVSGVLASKRISKIILTPDGERLDKDHALNPTHRQKLIEVFHDEMRESGLNVDLNLGFLLSNTHTSTLEVEKYFCEQLKICPRHIFGSDTLASMPRWVGNTTRYVQDRLKKIIIPRIGYPIPKDLDMDNYQIIDIPVDDLSSTLARERLRVQACVKDILSPHVQKVIKEYGLYQ